MTSRRPTDPAAVLASVLPRLPACFVVAALCAYAPPVRRRWRFPARRRAPRRIRCAITHSILTAYNSGTTSAATHNTISISPAANNLIVVRIGLHEPGGGVQTVTSVTGNSLTYTSIAASITHTDGVSATVRLHHFRAMGASPTAGAVQISLSGAAYCVAEIIQFAGVDTSGTNGSGAIAQAPAGSTGESAAPSTALSSFSNASNACFFSVVFVSNTTITFPALTTALTDQLFAEFDEGRARSAWQVGEDTSPDASLGASRFWCAQAFEIQVAAASAGAPPPRRRDHATRVLAIF